MALSATATFGVPLEQLMARPNQKTIPTLIKEVLRYINENAMDTEGIFRIKPNMRQLQELKVKIDADEDVDLFDYQDHHLIAGLLTQYLKELPEPLLTFDQYQNFVAAADISDVQARKQRVGELISQLPQHNKALLEVLLLFLARVGENSAHNKMTPANLAIVFGQILLRPKVETIESMMHAPKITTITKIMIEEFDSLFPKGPKRATPPASEPADAPASSTTPAGPIIGSSKNSNSSIAVAQRSRSLTQLRDAIDVAIKKARSRLDQLSEELHAAPTIEAAIEIAKTIRATNKILFPNDK